MYQNARQILDTVRGTFSSLSFDGHPDSLDCTRPKAEGEELSCLWFIATKLAENPSHSDSVEALAALTAVSLKRSFIGDPVLK